MSTLEKFTNRYPVNKTLRFELKPCFAEGVSKEERQNLLDRFWSEYLNGDLYKHDEERDESYPIVKELLDIFHRRFIHDALSGFECVTNHTWQNLFVLYATDKKSKDFKDEQKRMREYIAKCFTSHEWWPYVSSYKELLENIVPTLVRNDDDFYEEAHEKLGIDRKTMQMHLERFKSFSVYFTKFKENRDNIYKKEDQATSIANRIVNENFPKFADNIIVYSRLKEVCQDKLTSVQANLSDYLHGKTLDSIFMADFFNECLTQEGIEMYNWILGGSPNEGVVGVNSIGNDYVQHATDSPYRLKDLKMTMLYKQILSDRVRMSFLPEQFAKGREGELQLIDAIDTFSQQVINSGLLNKVTVILGQLARGEVDLNHVYVVGKNITELSKLLYGSWNALGEEIRSHKVVGKTKKDQAARNQDIEEWVEKKEVSLADIISFEPELLTEHSTGLMNLVSEFCYYRWDNEVKAWVQSRPILDFLSAYNNTFVPLRDRVREGATLSSDEDTKKQIKSYLDMFMNILHTAELFRLGKKGESLDKDAFYIDYDALFVSSDNSLTLSEIIPLYNKVRSFLTRKVKDEGKMLLKFDSPTLADGWDSNMELANNAIILLKGNKYYLLVLNPNNKPDLSLAANGNVGFKKMVYHQIGNVAADIPNLMVVDGQTVKKNGRRDKVTGENRILEELKNRYLPEHINRIRVSQSYSKSSPNYNKSDSLAYVEYYKQRLIEYKEGDIEFHFKETNEYDSYADFLEDVEQQKFSVSFIDYDENVVRRMVEQCQAFLFQIFNKDFQEGAHGTENMHTLYWREIFSPQNMVSLNYKLNGKAEFFYRRKLLSSTYVHRRSSVLVNKTYADGTPVSPADYLAFVKYFNREDDNLTDEQVRLLPQVKTNRAKIDIVKDKRYTEPKFMFHVPITINFKAPGIKSVKEFNYSVLEELRADKENVNIIGIDRGERNLIYVSVINQHGENVIPPRHFNVIETSTYDNMVRQYNYLEKLRQVEGNRDEARKNWSAIENIKELKSGYMSQVIHEITKLVVQYNAFIVLEDLNFGFKRGRFSVERQVYQKFEEMLIKKLNYLVFKKGGMSDTYATIRNGLQLTAPFTSFKDLGKQTGWLFYVPAEYTSKIDAQTGFVNLFNMKKAESEPKEFFGKFTSIEYKDGLFFFTFDYRNLTTVKTDYRNIWTLSSHGERIANVLNRESQRREPSRVGLTEEFKSVFSKYNIESNTVGKDDIINHPNADALCKELFYKFKLLLQMRNSISNSDEDYLISPVAGEHPFCTNDNTMGISDADANGAYHIALKGLYLLQNDFPMDGEFLKRITTAEWLEFVQKHEYRN